MHVHLIGIAGTAMTSLAKLLVDLKHQVSGSDEDVYPPMSTELERLGIRTRTPYSPANLRPAPDRVVIGNAIARGNPELEACLDRGLRYTSQAQALEDLVLPGRLPVVITGTHGKTTTTALLAWLLHSAGRDPGWFIGGVPLDLPATSAIGGGPEFVIEGDEYDTAYFDKRAKFHHYRPRILVVNTLEYDHADIYPNLDSILLEFRRLVNTVPRRGLIVVCGDCPATLSVVTRAHAEVLRTGLAEDNSLRATELRPEGGGIRFSLVDGGVKLAELKLGVAGRYNVQNALLALGVVRRLGIPLEAAAGALASFRGVRRRMELVGEARAIQVYDDFAHHPTAIRATLEAARARAGSGRLWAVLEPRSWSMRRNVHQRELPGALQVADVVAVAPVFQVEKLSAAEALDVPRVLAEVRAAGREVHAISSSDELARLVAARGLPGDVVVVMSNGGFDGAHGKILRALEAPPP